MSNDIDSAAERSLYTQGDLERGRRFALYTRKLKARVHWMAFVKEGGR